MSENKTEFSSRIGFLLVSLGMAFGAGNIWRFPRVCAANEGGAFLVAFLVATIVWAVPLLMIEMIMGKRTKLGTNGAFRNFAGKKNTWMGIWIGFCSMAIMFYYSVVTGWAIKYFTLGASGGLKAGTDTKVLWENFLATPSQTILFHVIAAVVAGWIIYKGVTKGLEVANKIIVPSIVILLLVVMVWSLSKPAAWQGMEYLFRPSLSGLLKPDTWLFAFTQAAWSVGAGWGLMLTYANYMGDDHDIGANSFVIAFADAGSSLLAAMAVLPLIFAISPSVEAANAAMASNNTGLTFIYLAAFFPTIPGGSIFGAIFFFALAISALASLLSMVELTCKNFEDVGFTRKKAAITSTIILILFGIPSALSYDFFDSQDLVWGVGLLISGIMFAYVAWRAGLDNIRDMINEDSWIHVGKWFNYCVMLFPVIFITVFGWWLWQGASWSSNWWKFEWYSPITMITQWVGLGIITILVNNWIANKIKAPYQEEFLNKRHKGGKTE